MCAISDYEHVCICRFASIRRATDWSQQAATRRADCGQQKQGNACRFLRDTSTRSSRVPSTMRATLSSRDPRITHAESGSKSCDPCFVMCMVTKSWCASKATYWLSNFFENISLPCRKIIRRVYVYPFGTPCHCAWFSTYQASMLQLALARKRAFFFHLYMLAQVLISSPNVRVKHDANPLRCMGSSNARSTWLMEMLHYNRMHILY